MTKTSLEIGVSILNVSSHRVRRRGKNHDGLDGVPVSLYFGTLGLQSEFLILGPKSYPKNSPIHEASGLWLL